MATVSQFEQRREFKWFNERTHPVLMKHFNQRQRDALFTEDLNASKHVSAVLISVVAAGCAMMAVLVAVIALWG